MIGLANKKVNRKKMMNKSFYGRDNLNALSPTDKIKVEVFLPFFERKKIDKMLDVGCNPQMTLFISKRLGAKPTGINIISQGFPKHGRWVCKDIEEGMPFSNSEFDMVFLGEVIEHVIDADFLVEEVKRVLKKGGYFVVTTPNLSSLWNRFFLLFGFQPHLFGVSSKKAYGNPFLKYDKFCGHLKLFTHKTLLEFLKDNDFSIEKVYGWNIHNPTDSFMKKSLRILISKFPSFSEDLMIICRKK